MVNVVSLTKTTKPATSFYKKLIALRETLIEVRNHLYDFDYNLYEDKFVYGAEELHEETILCLQGELDDIDELLYDSKYPLIHEAVNEGEYMTEALSAGSVLAAFLRDHASFNGGSSDMIDKIRKMEREIAEDLLVLMK